MASVLILILKLQKKFPKFNDGGDFVGNFVSNNKECDQFHNHSPKQTKRAWTTTTTTSSASTSFSLGPQHHIPRWLQDTREFKWSKDYKDLMYRVLRKSKYPKPKLGPLPVCTVKTYKSNSKYGSKSSIWWWRRRCSCRISNLPCFICVSTLLPLHWLFVFLCSSVSVQLF